MKPRRTPGPRFVPGHTPAATGVSAPRPLEFRGTAGLDVALVALAIAIAYGNTFAVPFCLDDFSSIRENPLIYHWRGAKSLWHFAPTRWIGYLTFALNYRLDHFHLFGFHLVNLVVHFLAGLALLAFARGALRAPRLSGAVPPLAGRWLPAVAALFFVLHPLQTEAVTYIVQRLASLAALFYVGALAAYVQARLAPAGARQTLWAGLCALATVLALLSKENSATLPAAVVLIEATLFHAGHRRWLATLAGATAALALFGMLVMFGHGTSLWSLAAADRLSRESGNISRGAYLATQMVVLLRYLRLAVFPAGLRLDYEFDLREGFLHADVLWAMAVHVALLGLAARLWRRRPLLSFGLVFYYLANAVESGLIPIRDLIFEHRTYLPNLGLCLAAAWLLLAELPRGIARARLAAVLVPAILIALAATTWARNQEWRDPVRLWGGNVTLARTKPRVWGLYGRSLLEAGRPAEGARAIEEAIRLRRARNDRGADNDLDMMNMAWSLRLLGRHEDALALSAEYMRQPLEGPVRARLLLNDGGVYFDQGRYREAEIAFRSSLLLAPESLPAMVDLASVCAASGKSAEAESLSLEVLKLDPDDPYARLNLDQVRAQRQLAQGDDLRRAGRLDAAIAAYRDAHRWLLEAARYNPGDSTVRRSVERVQAMIDALVSSTGRPPAN